MAIIYLALASNLGDREKYLRDALDRLGRFIDLARVSSTYETEAADAHTHILHIVCGGTTHLKPIDVFRRVRRIEKELGRIDGLRSNPRPIDIDILLYDRVIDLSPALTIPHPRLHERAFVLLPLVEIAPDLKHPRLRVTMRELLSQLDSVNDVRVYKKTGRV